MVVQPTGFVDRQLDDFFGARRQTNVPGNGAIAAADDELDGAADLVQLDTKIAQNLGGDPFSLAYKAEQ